MKCVREGWGEREGRGVAGRRPPTDTPPIHSHVFITLAAEVREPRDDETRWSDEANDGGGEKNDLKKKIKKIIMKLYIR